MVIHTNEVVIIVENDTVVAAAVILVTAVVVVPAMTAVLKVQGRKRRPKTYQHSTI